MNFLKLLIEKFKIFIQFHYKRDVIDSYLRFKKYWIFWLFWRILWVYTYYIINFCPIRPLPYVVKISIVLNLLQKWLCYIWTETANFKVFLRRSIHVFYNHDPWGQIFFGNLVSLAPPLICLCNMCTLPYCLSSW